MRGTVLDVANKRTYRKEVSAMLAAVGPRAKFTIRSGKQVKLRDCTPAEILESVLSMLAHVAVAPLGEITCATVPKTFLERGLVAAPKLTRDVLAAAQKFAFKSSKSRRLMRFMAAGEPIQYQAGKKPLDVWEAHDGELARGYTNATGEPVTVADVVKARRELAREIKRGEKIRVRW